MTYLAPLYFQRRRSFVVHRLVRCRRLVFTHGKEWKRSKKKRNEFILHKSSHLTWDLIQKTINLFFVYKFHPYLFPSYILNSQKIFIKRFVKDHVKIVCLWKILSSLLRQVSHKFHIFHNISTFTRFYDSLLSFIRVVVLEVLTFEHEEGRRRRRCRELSYKKKVKVYIIFIFLFIFME